MMNSQDMRNQAEFATGEAEHETDPYMAAEHDRRARQWHNAAEALESTENALVAAHARYYELAEELRAHKDNARKLALELGYTLTAAAWIRDNAAQAKNALAAHDKLFQ
jgi:hypothetical protein